jgi:ankyrin repeat protein
MMMLISIIEIILIIREFSPFFQLLYFSALSLASEYGRQSIVETILLHQEFFIKKVGQKLDLDSRDKRGMTALHKAAIKGHRSIALKLLQYGCDPNVGDKNGDTALTLASGENQYEIVKILLMANAHLNIKRNDKQTALIRVAVNTNNGNLARLLINSGANLNDSDLSLNSSCHYAAQKGNSFFSY